MRRMFVRATVTLLALAPSAAAQWTETTLTAARSKLAGARAGEVVLFAGGRDASGPSAVVDLYDAQADAWSTATLSVPRESLTAASVGPLALFAGGLGPGAAASATVDIYDASTGDWSVASLSVARYQLAGVALGDWILFAGGLDESGAKYDVVDLYHVPSDVWSSAQLSEARSSLGAVAAGGRALFAGGFWSVAADLFDPASGWTLEGLSQKRGALAATGMGRRALFAGGLDAGFAASDVVDIYDEATGLWSVAALSLPRSRPTGVTVEALAIFAGGWNDIGAGFSPDATVDLYDAVAGEWSSTVLPAPRADLAAVALDDRVLFAGGLDAAQQPSDVVWIYTPPLVGKGYCFGGGGLPCPCGNNVEGRAGCRNSTDHGSCLFAGGSASLALDDLVFEVDHLPVGQPALLFVGHNKIGGGAGAPLGDGLRCAGGSVRRLGVRLPDAGGRARFGPGLLTNAGAIAGDLRNFQVWYRDPINGPCGLGNNLSNGVEVVVAP